MFNGIVFCRISQIFGLDLELVPECIAKKSRSLGPRFYGRFISTSTSMQTSMHIASSYLTLSPAEFGGTSVLFPQVIPTCSRRSIPTSTPGRPRRDDLDLQVSVDRPKHHPIELRLAGSGGSMRPHLLMSLGWFWNIGTLE